jgi:hypothetical protein
VIPFAAAPALASIVAQNTTAPTISDADIESINQGRGVRFTPVSDDLNIRLRELMRPIVPTDDEYDDIFDRTEVMLGVIAEDASLQRVPDQHLSRGWIGRYAWRTKWATPGTFGEIFAECRAQGSSWQPLREGLFDSSVERAIAAFESMTERVNHARQRMW